LTAQAWIAARGDVLRSLADLPLHPPKPAADIVESYAPSILALMPVHDLLRGEDFAALRNDLRAMLMRLHDQFVRLARPAALVAALLRRR
jgi:hypothetical protein